jgi:hypothetical protein
VKRREKRKMKIWRNTGRMIILPVSIMLLILSSCQTAASRYTASEQNDISWLQKTGNMTVTFKGMMTFNIGDPTGTAITTYATELSVPAVPIIWMGNIFNGIITDGGPGNGLTDQVHGSVSADGAWINEMTYSRKVLNQLWWSSFSVTLVNVPITKVEGTNTTAIASFLKTGIDIRKYINNIDYSSGGSIGVTYASTDWEDTNKVLRLELEFATGKGARPTGGPSPGGGM